MIALLFEKLDFFISPYFQGGLPTFKNLGFSQKSARGQGFGHLLSPELLSLCFLWTFLAQPGD